MSEKILFIVFDLILAFIKLIGDDIVISSGTEYYIRNGKLLYFMADLSPNLSGDSISIGYWTDKTTLNSLLFINISMYEPYTVSIFGKPIIGERGYRSDVRTERK